jgi:hypothetical protein
LAGGGGHAGSVGNKNVHCIPNLVIFIEYRGFGVVAHAGGSHLVDAIANIMPPVVRFNIFNPAISSIAFASFTISTRIFLFVIFYLGIHGQGGQAPFIFPFSLSRVILFSW